MLSLRKLRSRKILHQEVFGKLRSVINLRSDTSFSIFLCGAAKTDPSSIRDKIRLQIESSRSKYSYEVYYPEDLFEEVLRGHDKADLLSLENLLAVSVDTVVVIVESAGAIAELGAFCNHSALKDKLTVFVDSKFKKDRSFINLGPLQYLSKSTESNVHFLPFNDESTPTIANIIRSSARNYGPMENVARYFFNPVQSIIPLLMSVSVMQPIERVILEESILGNESEGKNKHDKVLLAIGLNYLCSQGYLVNRGGFLSLSPAGRRYLKTPTSNLTYNTEISQTLKAARINYIYTNAKLLRR